MALAAQSRAMASSFLRFLEITHNDTPQSVRLLWTSDQPFAETSTWQHTTLTTTHPCPGGIGTHNLSRRAAADLRLRPRGHWDRHYNEITEINFSVDIQHVVCPYPFGSCIVERCRRTDTNLYKAWALYTSRKRHIKLNSVFNVGIREFTDGFHRVDCTSRQPWYFKQTSLYTLSVAIRMLKTDANHCPFVEVVMP